MSMITGEESWVFSKERVKRALQAVYSRLTPSIMHFIENCVGCMSCKVACPFYYADHLYSPVNKTEELRVIYRKAVTLSGRLLGKLVKAQEPESEKDILRILEYAYKCSDCGACYTTCPFGIDSGELIGVMRKFLTHLGYTPSTLKVLIEEELSRKYLTNKKLVSEWEKMLETIIGTIGKDPPTEGGDVLLAPSLYDAILIPEAIAGTAGILEAAGIKWSITPEPLALKPFMGWILGNEYLTLVVADRIDYHARKTGARKLLLVDGGIYYYFMRWVYPELRERKQPYQVLHVTELVHELVKKGLIEPKTLSGKVTWHPPCKLSRKSGVTIEPEGALKRIYSGYKRLPNHGVESICCGGGNGVALLTRRFRRILQDKYGIEVKLEGGEKEEWFLEEQELAYYIALKRKIDEIKTIEPEEIVIGCPTCKFSLEEGRRIFGVEFKIIHFAEAVWAALSR